jgi:hypothetical protein
LATWRWNVFRRTDRVASTDRAASLTFFEAYVNR